jgi:hypothetical protein
MFACRDVVKYYAVACIEMLSAYMSFRRGKGVLVDELCSNLTSC